MGVVQADAGAAVGAQAHAEHHLLQLGVAHLGDHRCGERIGRVGVERQEDRIEITAGRQPLLRQQQLGLVVVGAHRQQRQALRHLGRIALGAPHLDRAEAVGRAGRIGDGQARLLGVGIHVGLAALHLAGGEALGVEPAQAAGLGRVPPVLGEALAGPQRPAVADRGALLGGARVVGDRAGEVDLHVGDPGLLARVDRHHDLPGGLGLGRFAHVQGQAGREIAQGGEQFAGIGFGRAQQAGEFARIQVGERPVALQLHVAGEVLANLVGRPHLEGEGIAPVTRRSVLGVGAAEYLGTVVCGGGLVLLLQQAAAWQREGGAEKEGECG